VWGETQRDPDSDQDRQAMARLLLSRGEDVAAAIVAVASYQEVLVDNWNGGQYEAELAVPPRSLMLRGPSAPKLSTKFVPISLAPSVTGASVSLSNVLQPSRIGSLKS
jgi:hypothetical protein